MARWAWLLFFVVAPLTAQAQGPFPSPFNPRGTPEDQKACEKDAVKLCRHYLSDDTAVLRCFQKNRQKLTPACRAVLQKYGQ